MITEAVAIIKEINTAVMTLQNHLTVQVLMTTLTVGDRVQISNRMNPNVLKLTILFKVIRTPMLISMCKRVNIMNSIDREMKEEVEGVDLIITEGVIIIDKNWTQIKLVMSALTSTKFLFFF